MPIRKPIVKRKPLIAGHPRDLSLASQCGTSSVDMITEIATATSSSSSIKTKYKTNASISPSTFPYVNKKELENINKTCNQPQSLPVYEITYNSFPVRRDFMERNACDVCQEFICASGACVCDNAGSNNANHRSLPRFKRSTGFNGTKKYHKDINGCDDGFAINEKAGNVNEDESIEVMNNFENLKMRKLGCRGFIDKLNLNCVKNTEAKGNTKMKNKFIKHVYPICQTEICSSTYDSKTIDRVNSNKESVYSGDFYCYLCRPQLDNSLLTLQQQNTYQKPIDQLSCQSTEQHCFKGDFSSAYASDNTCVALPDNSLRDQYHPCVQITCSDINPNKKENKEKNKTRSKEKLAENLSYNFDNSSTLTMLSTTSNILHNNKPKTQQNQNSLKISHPLLFNYNTYNRDDKNC